MTDTLDETPRRQLPREERRAQILRAAAAAFSEEGFAATTMAKVASEAGITKLIVYRHFESKEELYRAVLAGMVDRLAGALVEAMESREDHLPPLEAVLRVAREDPYAYKLLVFHAPRENQFRDQALGYWTDSVGHLERLLGPSIEDPVMRGWIVRRLWLYLLDSVSLWLEHGDAEHDGRFVETATQGLTALYETWAGSTSGGG